MKGKVCQVKSECSDWDELISFAKAKIREMERALKDYESDRKLGKLCPVSSATPLRTQSSSQSEQPATQC